MAKIPFLRRLEEGFRASDAFAKTRFLTSCPNFLLGREKHANGFRIKWHTAVPESTGMHRKQKPLIMDTKGEEDAPLPNEFEYYSDDNGE